MKIEQGGTQPAKWPWRSLKVIDNVTIPYRL